MIRLNHSTGAYNDIINLNGILESIKIVYILIRYHIGNRQRTYFLNMMHLWGWTLWLIGKPILVYQIHFYCKGREGQTG